MKSVRFIAIITLAASTLTMNALSIIPIATNQATQVFKTIAGNDAINLDANHITYCAIAQDQSKTLGCIAASVNGSSIIIDEIIVAPNYEGRGIGSRLIETCLLHFLNQRSGFYKKLAIYVPAENKTIIELYQRKEFMHVPAHDIREKNLWCLQRDISKVSAFLLKAKLAAKSLGI